METNPIDILSNGKIAADCCSIARILPFNVFDIVSFIPFRLPFSIYTVPTPVLFFFFFLFLLILNSLMSFINRFQLIAIESCVFSLFLFVLLMLTPAASVAVVVERTRTRTFCVVTHRIVSAIIWILTTPLPLHIFLFSLMVRLSERVRQWRARLSRLVSV